MKKVYKYQLDVEDHQDVAIPSGAQILTVALQDEYLCLWALVETDNPPIWFKFRIAGTGHPIEENVKYISTFQMANGRLVFHVFQIIE